MAEVLKIDTISQIIRWLLLWGYVGFLGTLGLQMVHWTCQIHRQLVFCKLVGREVIKQGARSYVKHLCLITDSTFMIRTIFINGIPVF